jgi:hypothetical protein
MRLKVGFLFLVQMISPVRAQDAEFAAAITEINQAFRNHRFDPSVINAPFDRRQLDPRIIELEWNGVRGHVETALGRLNVGIRPINLPCEFRPLTSQDDHKGEVPHRLIPVFVFEKGNNRAKVALKTALSLRNDALWDYEPAMGKVLLPEPVHETILTTTGDFKREYHEEGSLNFVNIHKALQEILVDESLKEYKFQPIPAHIGPFGLHFATVWIACCKTQFVAYAFRLKVTLDRNPTRPGVWELISKVEIGRRYASQLDFHVVADSMKGDFLAEHISVSKSSILHDNGKTHIVMKPIFMPGEPVKPEIPPPIERMTAKDASTFEMLVPLFADLCRRKLLSPAEAKP